MASVVAQKVEEYFASYPRRSYSKGQILIHAGSEPDYVFYLTSGKVRQYDITDRGDEVVVNVFKPGAFFPMLWAITEKPNRYFFDAATPVEVLVAPREDVISFLQNNSDVLFDLLQRVYSGMDGLLERMTHLMSGNAQNRLLFELLIECRRFGAKDARGTYTIKINETELAARAGLTRETVSREMRKLSSMDLLRVGTGVIEVGNLSALEQRLNGDA